MNLEHICINKIECGDETVFLARVKRDSAEGEIRISEETANFLNLILGVPFCEENI
ncbi:hypothetical protein [Vallitalea okinawensis]|uniref:hypothetical protein n=1 Tax=Vallitalea okinawensis TaxID=2078660 RepID=UPI0013006B54|nr:hypothetical protein [Vallitalea okinawensis]